MRHRIRPKTTRETRAEMMRGGAARITAVHQYRKTNTPEQMFSKFSTTFNKRTLLESVFGNPFPRSIDEMFSTMMLPKPGHNLAEIVWAICRCAAYSAELSEFVQRRDTVDQHFVLGEGNLIQQDLSGIEEKFGTSMWLVQNRLLHGHLYDESEDIRRLASQITTSYPSKTFQSHLVSWFVKRIETRGKHVDLDDEIAAAFGRDGNVPALAYAQVKVSGNGKGDQKKIAPSLYIEGHTSIIDLYDLLCQHLLTVCTLRNVPKHVTELLRGSVKFLHNGIPDYRLANCAAALGTTAGAMTTAGARPQAFEHYLGGDYELAHKLAVAALDEAPHDMAPLVLLVRSRVRQVKGYDPDFGELISPLHRQLAKHLYNVFSLGDDTYASANAIFQVASLYYTQNWASYLRSTVIDALDEARAEFPTPAMTRAQFYDPIPSPLTRILAKGEAQAALKSNQVARSQSPALSAAFDLLLGGSSDSSPLTAARNSRYAARHALSTASYGTAIRSLSELATLSPPDAARIASLMSIATLSSNDYESAVRHCIDALVFSEETPSILPLEKVRKRLHDASNWPHTIDTPIFFGIYGIAGGSDAEAHHRFAFETFQKSNGIIKATDILHLVADVGMPRVIAYLRYVWTPEGMRQTRLYKSEADIEDARVEVCRLLVAIDESRAPEYRVEIGERVKKREISKGLKLVEQSKVYVDVPAIKKRLRKSLSAQYANYRALSSQTQSETSSLIDALGSALGAALGEVQVSTKRSIGDLLSEVEIHVVGASDNDEADTQFDGLYSEVIKEFLRGDNGLNAYLSTRVRHGRMASELRKAVAEDQLVTNEVDGKGRYAPNVYWKEKLSDLPDNDGAVIAEALQKFTTDFDATTAYARDELIQINVISGHGERNAKDRALLTYRTSNVERKHLHQQMRQLDDLGDFIDVCIDTLWSKTDQNLVRVRAAIDGEITRRFRHIFDELHEAAGKLPFSTGLSEFRNKIVRCDTATQNKLNEISGWFTRSTVYDREDYSPELAADIASTMVKKILPDIAGMPHIDVNTSAVAGNMPGHSLDAMVDAFYGLIINAVTHSDLSSSELEILIGLSLSGSEFSATVTNTVAPHKPTAEDLEKVTRTKASLQKSDSPTRAQIEGGSGTHKLWRAVNSPFYSEPKLVFDYIDEHRFSLTFGFKILEDADEGATG